MLRIFTIILTLLISLQLNAQVKVKGYYRKNGTYVKPHYRSSPDSNPYNNYSFPGNTNPYTGKKATGNPDTYLDNYYNKSTTKSSPRSTYSSESNSNYNRTYNTEKYSYSEPKINKVSYTTNYVNAISLNVRSGPSTDYSKTSSISYANEVRIIKTYSNGWKKIEYKDNSYYPVTKIGYVSGNYISASKPVRDKQWTGESNRYSFYLNGETVKTTNEWRDNDLIVYHGKDAYLLENYELNNNGKYRYAKSIASWSSTANSYHLYVNNQSVASETINEWSGNDLIVYNKNHAYLLKECRELNNDGKIRAAFEVPSWKVVDGGYHFYYQGNSVANKTTNTWSGKDLIVTYKNRKYRLKDYNSQPKGELSYAIELN
jgi:hypothetical protein